jgi:predicted secreted protein
MPEVFMRLAGKSRDGKTIALNAEIPIEVADDRCFDDVAQTGDGRGVRGYAKSKWGIVMGIWNVRENGGWVKDSVSMEDVVSVLNAKKIVCWSHIRQETFLLKKDPAREVVLKELEFDVLSLVEMTEDVVCLGLVDKYNTLAAIESCRGNEWTFRCLGEAVWAIQRHGRVIVKVEGSVVPTVRWREEGVTYVRASLTDFKETQVTTKKNWTVKVIVDKADK